MNWRAYVHLWLHNSQINPPLNTHLCKTHKINIEKAASQLIKLSQRWTAASLISFLLQGCLNQSQLHLDLICGAQWCGGVSRLSPFAGSSSSSQAQGKWGKWHHQAPLGDVLHLSVEIIHLLFAPVSTEDAQLENPIAQFSTVILNPVV